MSSSPFHETEGRRNTNNGKLVVMLSCFHKKLAVVQPCKSDSLLRLSVFTTSNVVREKLALACRRMACAINVEEERADD